jgi:DNA-binding MarR family transcriptional regulator
MISPAQAKIITVLLDGPHIREELRPKSGIYGSQFVDQMSRLIKKDYVLDEKIEGVKTKLITLTYEGKRALQRFERGEVEGPKVAPNSINRMVGTYTPQAAYYRNNGNLHIGSFGHARC